MLPNALTNIVFSYSWTVDIFIASVLILMVYIYNHLITIKHVLNSDNTLNHTPEYHVPKGKLKVLSGIS